MYISNACHSLLLSVMFQTAESHPICGRLKLTDFTPIVWTRLTKYKLLVERLVKQFVVQKTKVAELSGMAFRGYTSVAQLSCTLAYNFCLYN